MSKRKVTWLVVIAGFLLAVLPALATSDSASISGYTDNGYAASGDSDISWTFYDENPLGPSPNDYGITEGTTSTDIDDEQGSASVNSITDQFCWKDEILDNMGCSDTPASASYYHIGYDNDGSSAYGGSNHSVTDRDGASLYGSTYVDARP